jgi:energy-coupling factor transport system substrate-specific component
VQGLGAELVFAVFLYRVWNLPVAMLSGAVAGVALAVNDLVLWYPGSAATFAVIYVVSAVVSGAVVAGALSWCAVRGLAKTGALSRFAAGRVGARSDAPR